MGIASTLMGPSAVSHYRMCHSDIRIQCWTWYRWGNRTRWDTGVWCSQKWVRFYDRSNILRHILCIRTVSSGLSTYRIHTKLRLPNRTRSSIRLYTLNLVGLSGFDRADRRIQDRISRLVWCFRDLDKTFQVHTENNLTVPCFLLNEMQINLME